MMDLSEVKISPKKLKAIVADPEKSAKAVNLVYVHDKQPGITRQKAGDKFVYLVGKKKLSNKNTLERIKKLAIPPAWENVWICKFDNGHLQATGLDSRQRKQYRYHSLWNSLRNHTKFYRLYEFGQMVPTIRAQLQKDLAKRGLPVEKVLATVVCLMEQTSIRIGNNAYEKLYGSYGITTLKDQHLKISGGNIQFVFTGKKGISHNIKINSKKLARIVKQCRDIPGKELFQYYDQDGNHCAIDSGMVNQYLKSITGQDFTAKDIRTWLGTVKAISAFSEINIAETQRAAKKNVIGVIDQVATYLGNTRAVCKKYYVHPIIIDLYERCELHNYYKKLNHVKKSSKHSLLSREEKLLLHILEQEKLI